MPHAKRNLEHAPAGGFRMEYVSGIDGLSDWAMVAPAESATWVVCLQGYGWRERPFLKLGQ